MQGLLALFYSLCLPVVSPIGFASVPTTVPWIARSSSLVAHCSFCELSVSSTSPHGRYGFLFWLVCVFHSSWSGAFPGNVIDDVAGLNCERSAVAATSCRRADTRCGEARRGKGASGD